MKTRELKFKAWNPVEKVMGRPFTVRDLLSCYHEADHIDQTDIIYRQYVGLEDKNGREIYEGDIFRIEEVGTDTIDIMIWVVVVWVQEWAMFCTLRVEDEYPGYLANGLDALDEPMFWTYTLEDTNDRKHFLCGNIYENPELLQK